MERKIEFFSDGSSDNIKEKNAGWASVMIATADDGSRRIIVWYGHLETPATNNHGELIGLMGCAAMASLIGTVTTINADSQYAIGSLKVGSNWNPTKNVELIDLGKQIVRKSMCNLQWVKGHANCEGNNIADKFALYGRQRSNVNDPRYQSKYFPDRESIINYFKESLEGNK